MLAIDFAHVRKPSADIGGVYFSHERDVALCLQECLQKTQRRLVPLQRLLTMIATLVVLQVIVNGTGQGHSCTASGLQRRL
jgi:hypothetical protein